jgi:hypothetical protein
VGREGGVGLSPEPQSLVLELLRNIRADLARVDGKLETARMDLRSEIRSLRAEIAAGFGSVNTGIDSARKEICEQIAALRQEVVEYHSVFLAAQARRIEQRLSLPSIETN